MLVLRVPKMCFWPEKTRKNLELFEMHTCHWSGAQIWFKHKWRKVVTASLLLHCIGGCSWLRSWNEFCFSCVSGFRLKFSRIALWRKSLQLDSKSDLTTNGLILGLFVGKWLFCWLLICTDSNLHELLKCVLFLTTLNFFDD